MKSDCWFLDEVFLTIKGQLHHLWQAADQDDKVIADHKTEAMRQKYDTKVQSHKAVK